MTLYLPFIITSNVQEIMEGKIPFYPLLSSSKLEQLLSMVPAEMDKLRIENAVKNRVINDFSDLSSKAIKMGTLSYENGDYLSIDDRWMSEGKDAVVIINPQEFIERICVFNQDKYTNLRYIEAAEVVYDDVLYVENEKEFIINPYVETTADSWKKQIAIVSRCKQNIILQPDDKMRATEVFNIGNLCDGIDPVAVVIPTEELCNGRFPDVLYIEQVLSVLKNSEKYDMVFPYFTYMLKSVGCNIQDVKPKDNYIKLFQKVLSPEKWIPMTEMVKTPVFNSMMPILVFNRIDGMGTVKFVLNHIDFHLNRDSNGEFDDEFVVSLLDLVSSEFHTQFSHAVLLKSAYLGKVDDKRFALFDEQKSCINDRINYYYRLTKERLAQPNIFNYVSAFNEYWKLDMQITDDESILWYDSDYIIKYYEKAEQDIDKTMTSFSEGDIIERFRTI